MIGESDAPAFRHLQQPHKPMLGRKTINGCVKFRHGIMQIQNNFCAEQLRHDGGEDQYVRHIMDVDQIVTSSQAAPGKFGRTNRNECAILKIITRPAASLMIEWNPGYFQTIDNFAEWFGITFAQTNDFNVHALANQRLRFPSWPGVVWID